MPEYKAPIRNIQFAMNEVLDFQSHYAQLSFDDEASPDIVDAILEEAAKFAENIIAPLNSVGDEQGCTFDNGKVLTPAGFKEAYQQFVENGWSGLSQSTDFGGQGLPASLGSVVLEIMASANHAWLMYPSLTWGAINTISTHADSDLQQRLLPKMVAGNWSGTMCLTEPHAGSDLGLLRTKAIPNEDGTYSITGSKIFISSGEHDLTENIVHIVLARLPDAPDGVSGISLFVVPKILVNDDGSLGEANRVSCGSIEHKMGIHGNATCAMNFDSAKGYLIAKPNKGMSAMFTFINESRMGVAQQGHSHIEASFQTALLYAQEREQMRGIVRKNPEKAADPIIVHPDVRRMLLTQKAFSEGGRLLNYFCAQQIDIADKHSDQAQREQAETLLALLTPIAKGFLSEVSQEATSYGIQILGGHGYITEWGQEQRFRDTRITAIYEGTSGIQGLDLLGRKILASRGEVMTPFVTMVYGFCQKNSDSPYAQTTKKQFDQWLAITKEIGEKAAANADDVNAAAYDYLMLSGYTVMAYFMAMSGMVAEQAIESGSSEKEFYQAKLNAVEFYFERLLPRTESLSLTIRTGSSTLTQLSDETIGL